MSVNLPSRAEGNERLRARRRRARKFLTILITILLLAILGGCIYWLWQPSTRISAVTVYGGDQTLATYATSAMQGTYLGILPRDSSFFYPAHEIRASILAAHPDIAAVSLFREGFTGLSIKTITRVPIARWCGLAPTPGVIPYCYLFDGSGYIYAAASSSDQTLNSFALYAPLAASTSEPLSATVANPNGLPALFDFARQLSAFGAPVSAVVIRGDEVDDLIATSTRITYVLGQERAAYAALAAAKGDYNLGNGSVQYLDLRFPGKIYLKKN